jgi:two-component system, LytTR family, response regulator
MRLRSVIIDDEQAGIETLRLQIEKHITEIKVVAESTQAREAIELIENYKPEIIFLDINMPEMDGFELLKNLEWKEFNLVFTTAHREHALKALKLMPTDYLLKPIDHRELRVAVDKIKGSRNICKEAVDYASLNNINQYYNHKLGINSKDGVEFIETQEIIYMESKSNYTKLYLEDGRTIMTPKNLKEFDNQLCIANLNFMRVHHSFILNLHKVLRFIKDSDDIIMINHQKIPLSKSRRESFFKWLNP